MPRPLVILLVGVSLLMAGQFVYQKLGPTVTLGLMGVVGAVAGVGYLVWVGHPLAGRLAAHPAGRPVTGITRKPAFFSASMAP